MASSLAVFLAIGLVEQSDAPASWRHKNAQTLWLSRDGSILLSQNVLDSTVAGEPEHQIRIWDVAQQKHIGDLPLSKSQSGIVLALSDGGHRLVVRRTLHDLYATRADYNTYHGAKPSPVRCEVWALNEGRPRAKLLWHVASQKLDPVVAATFQGSNVVLLWPDRIETRSARGRVLRRIALKEKMGLDDTVESALSPNGHLAVLNCKSLWQIFDARNGKIIRTLQDLPSNSIFPADVEFSFDGRTVTSTTSEMSDPGLNQDVQPELVTDRWVWDVKSGKILAHWGNTGIFRPPFSPDSHAILHWDNLWEYTAPNARQGREPFEFVDLATHKRAAFQIPHPWGQDDHRWLLDVRVSGDGKVVAALDDKGNIWLQNSRPKN